MIRQAKQANVIKLELNVINYSLLLIVEKNSFKKNVFYTKNKHKDKIKKKYTVILFAAWINLSLLLVIRHWRKNKVKLIL